MVYTFVSAHMDTPVVSMSHTPIFGWEKCSTYHRNYHVQCASSTFMDL